MSLHLFLKRLKLSSFFSEKRFIPKCIFFGCLLLYKLSLEVVYYNIISPAYSYSFLCIDISVAKFWVSLLLFLLTAFLLVMSRDSVSRNIVTILYLFIYVPSISYYWLSNQSTIYTIFLSISIIIIILFSRLKLSNSTRINIPLKDKDIMALIFLFFTISMVLLIYIRGGIDARAFDFKNIYSLREEESIGGIMGYIKNWIPKLLFPLLFGYFFLKKKWVWLLTTVFFEILLYLSFGNKAFLLCIGWALICLFSAKKDFFPVWITSILILLVVVSGFLSYFEITHSLRDAVPYRLLFIPSQIQYQYYDFFSVNEKMYFAEGWIGKAFGMTNRFGEDVAFMIYRINSHDGGVSHSNTCFLADAYYNLGFFGMMLISCFSGFFFSLYNNFRRIPQSLVLASVSYILFSFADTGLQTTLFTGGMLFNFIILLLLNNSLLGRKIRTFRWCSAR